MRYLIIDSRAMKPDGLMENKRLRFRYSCSSHSASVPKYGAQIEHWSFNLSTEISLMHPSDRLFLLLLILFGVFAVLLWVHHARKEWETDEDKRV